MSVSPHDEIVCLFICVGFSTLKILSIIIIIDGMVISQTCALWCHQLLHSGAYVPISSFVPSCRVCILVVPGFSSLRVAAVSKL